MRAVSLLARELVAWLATTDRDHSGDPYDPAFQDIREGAAGGPRAAEYYYRNLFVTRYHASSVPQVPGPYGAYQSVLGDVMARGLQLCADVRASAIADALLDPYLADQAARHLGRYGAIL